MLNYLKLLLMLMFALGMMFVSMIQPMFMVSCLILIVLMYSYIIYMIMGSYWFSYALMMVMLSGVLVVFTYMVSLIPNESFESINLMLVFGLFFLMLEVCFMWLYNLKYSFMSMILWNSIFNMFNIFVLSFLLMIMLMVVWFSYIGYSALRI